MMPPPPQTQAADPRTATDQHSLSCCILHSTPAPVAKAPAMVCRQLDIHQERGPQRHPQTTSTATAPLALPTPQPDRIDQTTS
jgi:hypothetical protein